MKPRKTDCEVKHFLVLWSKQKHTCGQCNSFWQNEGNFLSYLPNIIVVGTNLIEETCSEINRI